MVTALNVFAASVGAPFDWYLTAFEVQVKTVLQTYLTTGEYPDLLLGRGPTDANKTDGDHKSTALLTALAVNHERFVRDYMTLILESALPDEFKVELCGRRAEVDNEAEVEACFKAASAGTRNIYGQAVRQSTLPDSSKLLLLRYC